MATRLAVLWGRSPYDILQTTYQKDMALYWALYLEEPWIFGNTAKLEKTIASWSGKRLNKGATVKKENFFT